MPSRKAQHPKVGGILGSRIVARHPGPGVCSFPPLQAALQLRPVRLCRPGQDTRAQAYSRLTEAWVDLSGGVAEGSNMCRLYSV